MRLRRSRTDLAKSSFKGAASPFAFDPRLCPGENFWQYLTPPDHLPASKRKSAPRLRALIPDTVVFIGPGQEPLWVYTNRQGWVERSNKVTEKLVVQKLGSAIYEEELVVVKKQAVVGPASGAPGLVTFNGNTLSILNTKEMVQLLNPAQQTEPFVIQRFVKSKGTRASIARGVYRFGRPPSGWTISNKSTFADERVPLPDRFCTHAAKYPLANSIYELSTAAAEPLQQINAGIAEYLSARFGRRVDELVCDFLKDDAGRIWLLQVVGFRLERGVTLPKRIARAVQAGSAASHTESTHEPMAAILANPMFQKRGDAREARKAQVQKLWDTIGDVDDDADDGRSLASKAPSSSTAATAPPPPGRMYHGEGGIGLVHDLGGGDGDPREPGAGKDAARTVSCKFCQAAYPESMLPFSMTWKMIQMTSQRLVQRLPRRRLKNQPWLLRRELHEVVAKPGEEERPNAKKFSRMSGASVSSEATRQYHPFRVCALCYEVFQREQKLIEVESQFAKVIGVGVQGAGPDVSLANKRIRHVVEPGGADPFSHLEHLADDMEAEAGVARDRGEGGSDGTARDTKVPTRPSGSPAKSVPFHRSAPASAGAAVLGEMSSEVVPKQMTLCRMMIVFHALHDVPDSLVNPPRTTTAEGLPMVRSAAPASFDAEAADKSRTDGGGPPTLGIAERKDMPASADEVDPENHGDDIDGAGGDDVGDGGDSNGGGGDGGDGDGGGGDDGGDGGNAAAGADLEIDMADLLADLESSSDESDTEEKKKEASANDASDGEEVHSHDGADHTGRNEGRGSDDGGDSPQGSPNRDHAAASARDAAADTVESPAQESAGADELVLAEANDLRDPAPERAVADDDDEPKVVTVDEALKDLDRVVVERPQRRMLSGVIAPPRTRHRRVPSARRRRGKLLGSPVRKQQRRRSRTAAQESMLDAPPTADDVSHRSPESRPDDAAHQSGGVTSPPATKLKRGASAVGGALVLAQGADIKPVFKSGADGEATMTWKKKGPRKGRRRKVRPSASPGSPRTGEVAGSASLSKQALAFAESMAELEAIDDAGLDAAAKLAKRSGRLFLEHSVLGERFVTNISLPPPDVRRNPATEVGSAGAFGASDSTPATSAFQRSEHEGFLVNGDPAEVERMAAAKRAASHTVPINRLFVHHFLAPNTPLDAPLQADSGLLQLLQSQLGVKLSLMKDEWCGEASSSESEEEPESPKRKKLDLGLDMSWLVDDGPSAAEEKKAAEKKARRLRRARGPQWERRQIGKATLPLGQFKSAFVLKLNFFAPLGLGMGQCSINATVGIERTRSAVETQPLLHQLRYHSGVFIPGPSYFASDPLPREWLDALPDRTEATVSGYSTQMPTAAQDLDTKLQHFADEYPSPERKADGSAERGDGAASGLDDERGAASASPAKRSDSTPPSTAQPTSGDAAEELKSSVAPTKRPRLNYGDEVRARYKSLGGKWFDGVVVAVSGTLEAPTYDVEYADGERDCGLDAKDVELVSAALPAALPATAIGRSRRQTGHAESSKSEEAAEEKLEEHRKPPKSPVVSPTRVADDDDGYSDEDFDEFDGEDDDEEAGSDGGRDSTAARSEAGAGNDAGSTAQSAPKASDEETDEMFAEWSGTIWCLSVSIGSLSGIPRSQARGKWKVSYKFLDHSREATSTDVGADKVAEFDSTHELLARGTLEKVCACISDDAEPAIQLTSPTGREFICVVDLPHPAGLEVSDTFEVEAARGGQAGGEMELEVKLSLRRKAPEHVYGPVPDSLVIGSDIAPNVVMVMSADRASDSEEMAAVIEARGGRSEVHLSDSDMDPDADWLT